MYIWGVYLKGKIFVILSWGSWCQGVVTSSPPPIFQHVYNSFVFTFLFSFSFCFNVFIFVFKFHLFLLSTFCFRRVVITSQHPFFNTCTYSRSHNISSGAFRSFKICGHFHFHNFSLGGIWLFKNYAHLYFHQLCLTFNFDLSIFALCSLSQHFIRANLTFQHFVHFHRFVFTFIFTSYITFYFHNI